jgi:hypothetical protein
MEAEAEYSRVALERLERRLELEHLVQILE